MTAGTFAHEGLADALGHQNAVLVIGPVVKFHDAGVGSGFAFPLCLHFSGDIDGVALEKRGWKFYLRHAEVGDGGAQVSDHSLKFRP